MQWRLDARLNNIELSWLNGQAPLMQVDQTGYLVLISDRHDHAERISHARVYIPLSVNDNEKRFSVLKAGLFVW